MYYENKKMIMKNKTNYFLIILSLVFLSSCSGKLDTDVLESTSEDGKMTVSVKGSRKTSVDPFLVTISATGFKKSATTQIHAGDLTAENVKFDWKNNQTCVITFTQRDGEKVTVPVSNNSL